jgi:hypothetical protein
LHMDIWKHQYERTHAASSETSLLSATQEKARSINTALTRWKKCWDEDMAVQYPPTSNMSPGSRRIGFCRDSTQFWWLARAFLQPSRVSDCRLAPEDKLRLSMRGLLQARSWTQSDAATRGEELGSVALIDPTYASSEDLVLDMRKLLRPVTDSHHHGNLGGNGSTPYYTRI